MKQILENQIAVANYPYGKYSFEYALDSLERIGGKKMELYACDPHFHIDDLSPSDISAAKRKIRDHHLQVICVTPEQCIYPINIANKNLVSRNRSIQTYVRCLEIC